MTFPLLQHTLPEPPALEEIDSCLAARRVAAAKRHRLPSAERRQKPVDDAPSRARPPLAGERDETRESPPAAEIRTEGGEEKAAGGAELPTEGGP